MKAGKAVPVLMLAFAVLMLGAGPLLLGNYWLRILSNVYMYAVLAQGINIMAGYTGYPAFGNVVFFGIGAYCTAILMVKLQAPFVVGLIAATCLCPLLVALVGPPLLRLKGHYFAIATLGFNEAVKEVAANITGVTGGGMGLSLPLPPSGPRANAVMFYYLLLGAMVVGTWITWEFSRRRLGAQCTAIRDNETKALAMGLHTTRCKTLAWMISATLTGFVGSINAYWMAYIEPPAVFDMAIAVKSFVIFLLGGAGTVLGPVAAAFVVELLATWTWSKLLNWHLGVMGTIIMVIIVLFPNGFREALRDLSANSPRLANARKRWFVRLTPRGKT
jgi:branched-chain amino acid transport system permease protein